MALCNSSAARTPETPVIITPCSTLSTQHLPHCRAYVRACVGVGGVRERRRPLATIGNGECNGESQAPRLPSASRWQQGVCIKAPRQGTSREKKPVKRKKSSREGALAWG
jgi:hypothetical protein